jgi:acetyl-CoA acyltransferase
LNIGRLATQIAGFPVTVSGATVNRFCSSGLEAIALASLRVMAGWSEVTMGGGVESMTYVPMGGNLPRPHPEHSRPMQTSMPPWASRRKTWPTVMV